MYIIAWVNNAFGAILCRAQKQERGAPERARRQGLSDCVRLGVQTRYFASGRKKEKKLIKLFSDVI